jgi:acyl carrier protein
MSDKVEIRQTIEGIFRDFFDDDEIQVTDEMTAEEVEEWDSISHIGLVLAVEKEFGIQFTTFEMSNFDNVGELISLVGEKLAA